ncbi:START-2 domain protein, putative [Babesia caballi]|uniref:START-2 domain protein, putative n=1 Tax=Babesia caballi TaxID=5871 RepID=A0AAV4LW99_BABCB|nr:START-2 domain protein, putative [Babesia caballi]
MDDNKSGSKEEVYTSGSNMSYTDMLIRYLLRILGSAIPFKRTLSYTFCARGEEGDEVMEEVVESDAEAEQEGEEQKNEAGEKSPERKWSVATEGMAGGEGDGSRSAKSEETEAPVPQIIVETGKVVFEQDTISRFQTAKSSHFSIQQLEHDDAIKERAVLIFVENSISLARTALEENKGVLVDKILCSMIEKVRAIYGKGEAEEEPTLHPLVNVMERLPKGTPEEVRRAIDEVAQDKRYITSLAEKLLVMDLFTKFNMGHMKEHILSYRQSFLSKLWPAALETASYELMEAARDGGEGGAGGSGGEETQNGTQSAPGGESDEPESLTITPRVVTRLPEKQTLAVPGDEVGDKKYGKHGRLIALASRFLPTRKNTMFGQHFGKSKVKTADGWVKAPYRTLETFYRFEKDGSVSVKVRGKISTELLQVICVINETDLSSEWVPFLKEAANVHEYSRTTKIFRQTYEYPVIGIKQTSVFGIAINALDESGCFILGCMGPPETRQDVEQLARVLRDGGIRDTAPFVAYEGGKSRLMGVEVTPIPQNVRQKSADLCFMLYPMQNHTLVELNANIVPEVRLVPTRVITYIIKKVVISIFKRIALMSNSFQSTPFAQRIKQNREFYDWVAELHAKFLGRGERQNYNISLCTYDPDGPDE